MKHLKKYDKLRLKYKSYLLLKQRQEKNYLNFFNAKKQTEQDSYQKGDLLALNILNIIASFLLIFNALDDSQLKPLGISCLPFIITAFLICFFAKHIIHFQNAMQVFYRINNSLAIILAIIENYLLQFDEIYLILADAIIGLYLIIIIKNMKEKINDRLN